MIAKIKLFKPFLFIFIISAFALSAWAQLAKPVEKPIIAPHRPALSPNGKTLAFVYKGNIWVVPSVGGRAIRLTDSVEQDTMPVFSPDGQWVAFASQRTGNTDIYVVPSQGGTPRQLTISGAGVPYDWSPDGKRILFLGSRNTLDKTLYEIDVKSMKFYKLISDFKGINYPAYSHDGKLVVYVRHGFPWYRPRYHGSAAAQVWVLDLVSLKPRQITKDSGQHLMPKFLSDNRTIFCTATGEVTPSTTKLGETPTKFVDNSKRTPNLWAFGMNGNAKQLTQFVSGAVRWPSISRKSGDIVFEYEGAVWLLKKGASEPVKVSIYAPTDDKLNTVSRETLTSGADQAEISPDGKTIAFSMKNELWSVPVEKAKKRNPDDAKRLTDYIGWDGDFCWSPDGKKIYFCSDRLGAIGLFELDIETLKVNKIFNPKSDVFGVKLTPDKKQIAFWVADEGLYAIPLDTKKAAKLVDLPSTGDWGRGGVQFEFSPDMQWLVYNALDEQYTVNLWVIPVKGGKAVNITKKSVYHMQPQWSPDGKYLFFQSNRDEDGIYLLPLKPENSLLEDVEMKYDLPKDISTVKVEIDFDNIELRIRKYISLHSGAGLTLAPNGKFYCIGNGDISSFTYDGKDSKRITSGGGVQSFELTPDGKKLLVIKSNTLYTLTLEDNSFNQVTFSAAYERDTKLERKAAITQLWRTLNRQFYDVNMHGRDWDAIRKRYEPQLEAVATNQEFGDLLNMMVGELDSSHAEIGPARSGPRGDEFPSLGFFWDDNYHGPGIRIKEVPDGAPGSYPKAKLNTGEYVLQINGKDVQLDENLYKIIKNKTGKDLEFLVNDRPTKKGARKVTYKGLNGGELWVINYTNRLRRYRQLVEKRSGGKIGYMHLPSMGYDELGHFEHEFYAAGSGKEAMIIDVRFNGGGYVAGSIVDWLAVKPWAYTTARRSKPLMAPDHSWGKPLAVLINENSASNAEMFPYYIKMTGIGVVLGMPTPGYVIGTPSGPLVDGTWARFPSVGMYRLDGTSQENDGEKPDIQVDLTNDDWAANRDPQLEAAVDALMKKIGN
ncbi:MAG: S41 family peptidase [bacterium]